MFQFLFTYYSRQKFAISMLFFISLVLSIIIATIPLLIKYIIDIYTSAAASQLNSNNLFLLVSALAITFIVFTGLQPLLENRIINKTNFEIRKAIMHKLKYKKVELIRENQSKILQVITQDIPYCQSLLTSFLFNIVIQLLTFIIIISILLNMNFELGILLLISIPLYILIYLYFGKKIEKVNKKFLVAKDSLTGNITNINTNIKILKHIQNEKTFFDKYNDSLNSISHWYKKTGIINSAIKALFVFLQVTILVIVIIHGKNLVDTGALTIGSYIAYVMFVFNFFSPIQQLVSLLMGVKTARVSIKRVMEVYQYEEENEKNKSYEEFSEGLINIKNYRFPYNTKIEKTEISFDVIPNTLNFLIGKNGSGKTTFINSLNRYYEIPNNTITVDSKDLNEYSLKYLRENMRTLYQDSQVSIDDISTYIENIKVKKNNIDIQVQKFIDTNLKKYAGKEKIEQLSGGEKQLLCFIDAIVRKPKILIIDEGFSNLDFEMVKKCLEILKKVSSNTTILIITHDSQQIDLYQSNLINFS